MADQPTSRLEGMKGALYCLAVLLIGIPLVDWGRGIFPSAIGNSTWRFAVTQILANYLVTPAVGLTVAVVTAKSMEDWGVLRGLRGLLRVASVLFGVLVVLFPFDALQARRVMQPPARAVFNTGMATGFIHLIMMLVFALLLTRATSRMLRHEPKASTGAEEAKQKLVVRP